MALFYAIDRTNGQFVYAFPLVEGINWTSGLDPRPEDQRSTKR